MYLIVEGRSWAVDIAQLVERSPAQGLGFDPQYHRKWYGGACCIVSALERHRGQKFKVILRNREFEISPRDMRTCMIYIYISSIYHAHTQRD